MNKHPRQVAFRSPQDIFSLKQQLFETESDEIQNRAIQRILTLETRNKLPHTLLSTAYLLQIQQNFQKKLSIEGSFPKIDEISLQLSATMGLIRFVNGLLDPSQQSQYAIPLNLLAKKIGLPSWFVELRHAGTHEGLPSLEMLEIGVSSALEWLKLNYWEKLKYKNDEDEMIRKNNDGGDDCDRGGGDDCDNNIDWKDLIRRYRRIRRLNINKFIKFGDSSEEGKEYWKIINFFEKGINDENFYKILMFKNCIINDKYKWEQLKLLYEPFFINFLRKEKLNQFLIKILDKLIFKIYEFSKFQTICDDHYNADDEDLRSKEMYNLQEIKQVKLWCNWILEKINPIDHERLILKLVDIIGKTKQEFSIELLIKLQSKLINNDDDGNNLIKENLQIKINEINEKIYNNKPQNNDKRSLKEIDYDNNDENIDIFQDLENLKKRIKLNTKLPIKFFEKAQDWEAKPFGIL